MSPRGRKLFSPGCKPRVSLMFTSFSPPCAAAGGAGWGKRGVRARDPGAEAPGYP
ncbi:hypothetical protein KKF34_03560 [Myxococcota bacterium]|nr:hypothetical protein [Myxococcota bacterium]MBU1495934.1 hypothetical protein [Myxococcota bacterium]